MTVDIWSDIRCPFCFVGKRKFEKALAKFNHSSEVKVNWHSFQLNPEIETQPETDPFEFFAQLKGISVEQAKAMHQHAFNAGKEAGIDFDFENSKVANSMRAHQLIQLAKQHNLANEVEETLFSAQFLEGKNIDDEETLVEIGKQAGLDESEVRNALKSDEMTYLVKQDMQMASQLGINAVPFFVFNQKYGVSGAQQPELFLEVLEKTWAEMQPSETIQKIDGDGKSCDINGNCN